MSAAPLGWPVLLLLIAVSGALLAIVRWDMRRHAQRLEADHDARIISEAREQLAIDIIFRIITCDIEETGQ